MKTLSDYYKLYSDELFEYCLPFWLKHGVDKKFGGLYTCLDRSGQIYSTDKSVWMQGRAAYMFSHLNNVYGDNGEWLNLAKSCIDFLNDYCIDKTDGRMFFTVTNDGKPLRKRRYFFSETFYIIANAEYYLATGDDTALKNAKRYYDFVFDIYKNPENDPYKITPKSYATTRSLKTLANPMILLNVNSIMRECDKQNKKKYDDIAKVLINDIKAFKYKDTNLMLENIGLNGEYYQDISSCRIINPGHSIELGWFLLSEAEHLNDSELFLFAEKIFNEAYAFGFDDKYGGILYFKDVENKPVEAYEHDMKLWWPHAEAIIASLMLFDRTENTKYFEIFEYLTEYSFEKFSDREYGEWLGYLRRDSKPTEPACKGHTYKGPFHVIRMLSIVERILAHKIKR